MYSQPNFNILNKSFEKFKNLINTKKKVKINFSSPKETH